MSKTIQLKKDGENVYPISWQIIYPVGAIYMSVVETSPSTLFGGTWEQITNTFLLACGSNYSAGSTGGEAMHTLSTSEIPSHTHTFTGSSATTSSSGTHMHDIYYCTSGAGGNTGGYVALGASASGGISALAQSNGDHTHTVTAKGSNSSTGGGGSHNNMPPYLAVYMWKRTA